MTEELIQTSAERVERSFWSTKDFEERLQVIIPNEADRDGWIGSKRLQASSIELSLGDEVFISSKKELQRLSEKENYVKIAPGDFALLIAKEYIEIPPDCMGFISIKTTLKFSGLINISGFHVDPGFKGKLIYSVYNAGTIDVILKYGDPIFILFMTYIRQGAHPYAGEHDGQQHIKSKDMMPLMGAGIPIHNIEHRLRTVETTLTIYGGLLIALVVLFIKFMIK